MKKYIILSILIITVLSSCKKVKHDQIQAGIYVKQYKTNTPLANAMVLITRGAPGSGVGTQIVDTLYTDANGRVSYNKQVDEDYMYYAEAYKDGYFDTHNQQVDVRPGEKNFTTTIYMYAHSWVKLHVKNINPYDQFDFIDIQSVCYQYIFYGTDVDTSITWCDECNCAWRANFHYEYAIGFYKNNLLNILHIDFTPSPHDTITVEINY